MLKSKFASLVIIIGLIWSQTGVVVAQSIGSSPSFSDIAVGSQYFAATDFLKSKGIISGYKDGSFKPEITINRAEAVKILMLARDYLKLPRGTTQKISFPDVKSTAWYYNYVVQAFSLGIVKGYEDGTFKPANEINRAESLKIIILSLTENYQSAKVEVAPFIDVKVDDWYSEYAFYAKSRQIFEPESSGKLMPGNNITRGDFAESIYRLIYIEENDLPKFPVDLNWQACKDAENGFVLKTPLEWQKIQAGNDLILWHQDSDGGQVSFARVYPNSAVLVIARDLNERNLTLQQYLKLLDYGSTATIISDTINNLEYSTVYLKDNGIQDSYFKLPDGSILILYGQVGGGALADQLTREMRYMISDVRAYSESKDSSLADCALKVVQDQVDPLSLFRSKILVKGEGEAALNLLGETKIIFTDTIGIGTGPIDYYFSATYNLTAKYERDSKTILAEKEGETSAF